MTLSFFKALALFLGTTIGVGVFGLPYVASKAGFLPVLFYFLLLTPIVVAAHFIWGRISLGTEGSHQLPGYFGIYMGNIWQRLFLLTTIFGLVGTLLAYLIVGGEFLNSLLGEYTGGNVLIYTILFFSLGAFLISLGLKRIAEIEIVFLLILLGMTVIFLLESANFINLDYFKMINKQFVALPYGIVLFSLWGSTIVPLIKEIVGNDERAVDRVIISGIIISALIYLFFIFVVFGVSGQRTSKEALSGLSGIIGSNILKLGFILGILNIFDSFVSLGISLKKVIYYDLKLSSKTSWFIACLAPLSLFLLGFREFIDVIGLVGALTIGAEGIMIVFLYRAFLKKIFSKKMNPVFYILPLFFIIGIVIEIIYFI